MDFTSYPVTRPGLRNMHWPVDLIRVSRELKVALNGSPDRLKREVPEDGSRASFRNVVL
jgi:hypothetical protein